jgi:hypothetical protein
VSIFTAHLVEPATVAELRALLADLEGQQRRERRAFEDGYRAGHAAGWDIGYGYRCNEEHAMWANLKRRMRDHANSPIRTRQGE